MKLVYTSKFKYGASTVYCYNICKYGRVVSNCWLTAFLGSVFTTTQDTVNEILANFGR